jgi:2-succinyl-6-hydroxy-2,4-cyclohexadiene-1-carboxylate synthase
VIRNPLATALAHDTSGRVGGERVVLVHGFTQTRRSWHLVRARLDEQRQTVAVDLPGHGESGDLPLDLAEGAAALGRTGGRATYVGYSMGGRLTLRLAVDAPALVARMVLVSATAGLDDAAARRDRRQSDEALARRLERVGLPTFLEEWLGQPLFANLPVGAADLDDRLGNTAAGLAASLRLAGTGTQLPLWDRLGGLTMPVLVVAGALDAKFVASGERLAAGIPRAELAVVPGAGHAVHLERPDAFADVLLGWLDRSGPEGQTDGGE